MWLKNPAMNLKEEYECILSKSKSVKPVEKYKYIYFQTESFSNLQR
jgi:hypothetical protein